MGLLALRCPSCGADLELDDTRETAFCQFCGSKILVQDEVQRIRVEHTGSVKIDESDKMNNYLTLAMQAYSCGNYVEAYKYYAMALECNPQMPEAMIKKGLCAAQLSSFLDVRIAETSGAVRTAGQQLGCSAEKAQTKAGLFREVAGFVTKYYDANKLKHGQIFETISLAQGYFKTMNELQILCIAALDFADDNTTIALPELEKEKKLLVEKGLEISRAALQTVSYQAGTQQIADKNGNIVTKPIYQKMSPADPKACREFAEQMKTRYNNLPGTLAEIARYDKEMEREQGVIDSFETALAQYFITCPEDEKTYRHPGLFGAKKKLAAVEEKFPQSLRDQKVLAEAAKKDLAATTKAKKAYIAQNTKK